MLFGGFWLYNGINHFRKAAMLEPYTASKSVPAPKAAVYGTGIMLIIAGAGIILGIYVPFAVFLLALFLIPVTLIMHNFWTVKEPMARMTEQVMFMKNAALLGAAIAYLFVPLPWPLSLLS